MIYIDKVFIIGFPENMQVKKELFQSRLKTFGVRFDTPMEIVEVPEKEQIGNALSRYRLQLHANGSGDTASCTEIALAIGHWQVWQKARKEKYESILVLEEGFVPVGKGYHRLNPEGDWDILHLRRQPDDGGASENGDILYGVGDWTSPPISADPFGYVISGPGIRKVLKSGYDKKLIPTGEFLSSIQGVHPNEDVARLFSNCIEALAPGDNLVERDSTWPIAVERARRLADGYKPLRAALFDVLGKREAQWAKK